MIIFPTQFVWTFLWQQRTRSVKCQIFNGTHMWCTKMLRLKLKKLRSSTLNCIQFVCPWDRHQHGSYTTMQEPGSSGCHSEFLVSVYCKVRNYIFSSKRLTNDANSVWWFMSRSQEVYQSICKNKLWQVSQQVNSY